MEKIKINNEFYDILSINQNENILEIKFNKIVDLSKKDLSVIELYTEGGLKCSTFKSYTTIYKEDGKIVILSNNGSVYVEPEITEPESYVPTPIDPTAQLEENKKNKIKQSTTELDKYLEAHPLLYTDGLYYTVTKEKQSLLANRLLSYQLELQMGIENPSLTWNSTGEMCVEWQYEDLVNLALAIKNYVEPFVMKQQAYEKQIMACSTIEELNNVVINYEEDT